MAKFGEIFERIWRNFDCVYPATLLKKQKELEKAKWRPDSSAPDDPAAPVARLHQVPRESRTSALTPGVSSPLPLPPSPLGLVGVGHSTPPGGDEPRTGPSRPYSAGLSVQCGLWSVDPTPGQRRECARTLGRAFGVPWGATRQAVNLGASSLRKTPSYLRKRILSERPFWKVRAEHRGALISAVQPPPRLTSLVRCRTDSSSFPVTEGRRQKPLKGASIRRAQPAPNPSSHLRGCSSPCPRCFTAPT